MKPQTITVTLDHPETGESYKVYADASETDFGIGSFECQGVRGVQSIPGVEINNVRLADGSDVPWKLSDGDIEALEEAARDHFEAEAEDYDEFDLWDDRNS